MVRAILILALVAGAFAGQNSVSESAQEQALEQTWSNELAENQKDTPIQRVVKLLKEMKAQLEKEADSDAELYDQMVCWCETNDKEKTKAIADADAKDKELVAEIEERSAGHGTLATEIDATKKMIAEESAALAEATSLREKEAAEFSQEEKDMIQAVTNLKNAVIVLSKHHSGSLLQLSPQMLSSLTAVLQDAALKHEFLLGDSETAQSTRSSLQSALIQWQAGGQESSNLRKLRSALDTTNLSPTETLPLKFAAQILADSAKNAQEGESGALLQKDQKQPAGYQSYAPASGQIFGILKQMKEEFETNLTNAQKEEMASQEEYAALKAAKEEQIAAAKLKLDDMLQQFAGNKKALFDAKEDLETTRKTRSADVEFLRNLRLTCQGLDKQWEERSKSRSDEIKAVSEAISIITDDDARDLMAKTVTLLQASSVSNSNTNTEERVMRSRAASVLRKFLQQPEFDDLLDAWKDRKNQALETPKAQLSTLVVSVQLDAFTKVKEAMDKMINELKDQQAEEVKLKEFCTSEFNKNERETYEKTEDKENLERKITELEALMTRLAKEIEEAKTRIADTKVEIKKAGEEREKANAEFQTTVSDQRATQAILKKALKKLEAFYKKKALLQQKEDPTPPVHFQPMKKNAGASPVMGLIEQIIEESKVTENDALAAEKEAQADYEKFVKDSNALVDELSESITEQSTTKATSDENKAQAHADKKNTEAELEGLASYLADLHDQCDFVVKNFDVRQKGRLQEIEAIQQAKGILSGAMSK